MSFFDPREFDVKPKVEIDFLPVDNYVGQIENVFTYKKNDQQILVLVFNILFPLEHRNKKTKDFIVIDELNKPKDKGKIYYDRKRLAGLLKKLDLADRPLDDINVLTHRVTKFLLKDFNGRNSFETYLDLDEKEKSLIPKDVLEDIEFDAANSDGGLPF